MNLDDWKERGIISAEQYALLSNLAHREPFSVFLELNILLYAGVIAFIGGLTWTVQTYSAQLGDLVILAVLSGILAASLWYCFSRALPWSATESPSPNPVFDYVLYLGSLTWSVELSYIETRFHLLSGQWDIYLLATSCVFFLLAYRFDNRLVLSLALSALAGWFGIRISHLPGINDSAYREFAILYSLLTAVTGITLDRLSIKTHFLLTYLNLAANAFFLAVLSGVFKHEDYGLWFLLLVIACGASLAYGLTKRQFSFVAYAAVYGYAGMSSVLIRHVDDSTAVFSYFVVTGILMLVLLTAIARRFGRES
jgi:hypothetical protein